jgi:predicted HNH restriction endonuclease
MRNFWHNIVVLENQVLLTLTDRSPFKINSVSNERVVVLPNISGSPRIIKKSVFEKAYNQLEENGSIDLDEIRRFINFSPVYVMAILESFPEVNKVKQGRKIVLTYDSSNLKKVEKKIYPEEIFDDKNLIEGAKKKIYVNAYERNKEARAKCIKYYGTNCYICEMEFSDIYGKLGKDFIHVHHLVEISKIKANYVVDPIKDLIPVCPNCHAMLHYGKYEVNVNALKKIVNERKRSI